MPIDVTLVDLAVRVVWEGKAKDPTACGIVQALRVVLLQKFKTRQCCGTFLPVNGAGQARKEKWLVNTTTLAPLTARLCSRVVNLSDPAASLVMQTGMVS